MIHPATILAVLWSVAMYLAMYGWSVLTWLYGWYRVTAWVLWPIAVLFVLALRGGR